MEDTDHRRGQPGASRPDSGEAERPFWCFISYRHADNTEKGRSWASWLHHELETFEVPRDLVGAKNDFGRLIPERMYPVFRDEEELPASADLSEAIIHALRRSMSLIVICSPASRESKFVNEEVRLFKSYGGADRTCGMVIRGSLNPSAQDACLALPLIRKVGPRGHIEAGYDNPLLIDMRDETGAEDWTDPTLRRAALVRAGGDPGELDELSRSREDRHQEARLQLIAWVLGVGEDRLRQAQEKSRRRERAGRYLVGLFWLMVGLAAVAAAAFGLRLAGQMTHSIDESAAAAKSVELRAAQVESEARRNDEEALRLKAESRYREGLGFVHARRLREAAEAFHDASEAGHVAASFEYARLLLGEGGQEGTSVAMRLLEGAAAKGHPGALVALGRTLIEGNKSPVEFARGVSMLREAVRLGDESGVLSLAKALQKTSPTEARQLFRKAAEAGDPEACWILGSLLRAETPVSADGAAAPEWFRWTWKAAEKGRLEAKREAGIACWDGTLGPSPSRTGVEERAALRGLLDVSMRGDAASTAFLRKLFANRINYPRDEEARLQFAIEGAQAGLPEAMLAAGEYVASRSQAFNDAAFQEAWAWFNRAAKAGMELEASLLQGDAATALAVKASGPEVAKFRQAALDAYESAARRSSLAAMVSAARLSLEMGNEDSAIRWFAEAEQAGSFEARRQLATLMFRRTKDSPAALALLRKGTDAGDGEAALILGDWMAARARTSEQLALTLEVYSKGAESGNGRCGLKAASMIRMGKGGVASVLRAAQLERRAAETGDPACMLERARRLIDGGFKQGSAAEAHAWLSLAAEAGLAKECAPLLARLAGSLDESAKAESGRLRAEFARRLVKPSSGAVGPR